MRVQVLSLSDAGQRALGRYVSGTAGDVKSAFERALMELEDALDSAGVDESEVDQFYNAASIAFENVRHTCKVAKGENVVVRLFW